MTGWTRKKLGTLDEALGAHLSNSDSVEPYVQVLVYTRSAARKAAKEFQPKELTLDYLRAEVCKVCRAQHLYECDVPIGWSLNCALLKKNIK